MPTIRIKYDVDDKDLLKADKAIGKTDKSTEQLRKETDKLGKEMKETGDKGAKGFFTLKQAIGAISFVAIIAGAKELISKTIQVSAEFQKFAAVLETTLGSKSKAQIAMAQIVKFASETPFQVNQLTDAFVKLANQGFIPNTKQLRSLGDLAASTGKDFDMLAEAIIDAQVGEFERLKEFGIRASKQGDQVTFAFKGVETQVDFTTESIQDYLLSLGEVEGVSGSMANISETLGGKISNLGDQFDQFFRMLGKANDGILKNSVELLISLLEGVNATLKTDIDADLERTADAYNNLLDVLNVSKDLSGDQISSVLTVVNKQLEMTSKQSKETTEDWNAYIKAINEGTETTVKDGEALFNNYNKLRAEEEALKLVRDDLIALENNNKEAIEQRTEAIDRALAAEKESVTVVRDLMIELERLNEFSDDEIFRKWADSIKEDFIPAVVSAEDIYSQAISEGDAAVDKIVKKEQDAADAVYDAWKESYDKRRELERDALVTGLEITQMFLESQIQAREIDFENLRQSRERDIENAGNNAAAKEIINKRYDQKEKRARQQAAEEKKRATLNQILIENAFGIAKAIAAAPPPINIPLIAIQTTLGLAQYGIAANTPAYKDGVIDLDGPGTGTSDSIVARLSRGESVTPAAHTARSKEVLNAIHSGKLDDKTYKQMMFGGNMFNKSESFDDSRIVDAIKNNKAPDVITIAGQIYEVKSKGKNLKERIRRKMLN